MVTVGHPYGLVVQKGPSYFLTKRRYTLGVYKLSFRRPRWTLTGSPSDTDGPETSSWTLPDPVHFTRTSKDDPCGRLTRVRVRTTCHVTISVSVLREVSPCPVRDRRLSEGRRERPTSLPTSDNPVSCERRRGERNKMGSLDEKR